LFSGKKRERQRRNLGRYFGQHQAIGKTRLFVLSRKKGKDTGDKNREKFGPERPWGTKKVEPPHVIEQQTRDSTGPK